MSFNFLELKVPPIAQLIICLIGIYGASLWLPVYSDYENLRMTSSFLLAVFGVVIAIAGVLQFRKNRTTVDPRFPKNANRLVQDGIYRLTRNPMYLGMLSGLVAFSLYLGSFFGLGLCLLFILYMNRFQIIPEERTLRTIFGRDYLDYTERVRRWF